MKVGGNSTPLGEIFAKVENATPALHPQTIKLMNNQRGITGKQAVKLPIKIQPVKIKQNPEDGENLKMTKAKKMLIRNKIKVKKQLGGAKVLK